MSSRGLFWPGTLPSLLRRIIWASWTFFTIQMPEEPTSTHGDHPRSILRYWILCIRVRTDEWEAFVEGIKYVVDWIYTSTNASREAFMELLPPDVTTAHLCLRLQLFYINVREVLRYDGVSVELWQRLYVPQALSNALFNMGTIWKTKPFCLFQSTSFNVGVMLLCRHAILWRELYMARMTLNHSEI